MVTSPRKPRYKTKGRPTTRHGTRMKVELVVMVPLEGFKPRPGCLSLDIPGILLRRFATSNFLFLYATSLS
jgi:hypothetical protein